MFKLQYENARGQSIELFDYPFRLISVEGLGEVEATIQTQKAPSQDGETYIDSVLEPRYMTIELKIEGTDAADTESKRRMLASIFNPRLGPGTLKYVRDDDVKVLNAVPESVPFFPDGLVNRKDTFQKVLIYLIAPNPYWKSTRVTEEPAFEPKFHFPFAGPFVMGVQRTDRIIDNGGDAPMPIQVDFYGPADSPMIANETTGEFIRINKRLEENEIFRIDTTDSVKSIIYIDEDGNEENVFHWIDINSTFFKLELGENEITCNCALSNNQKDFDIYYSKLYNAV